MLRSSSIKWEIKLIPSSFRFVFFRKSIYILKSKNCNAKVSITNFSTPNKHRISADLSQGKFLYLFHVENSLSNWIQKGRWLSRSYQRHSILVVLICISTANANFSIPNYLTELIHGFKRSYTDITGEIHGPPKSLPKKGGILFLKGATSASLLPKWDSKVWWKRIHLL